MKYGVLAVMVMTAVSFAGCEGTSLEQVVEKSHQERIDQINAGRPVAKGARDGIGTYSSDGKPLTLSAQDNSSN